MRTGLLRFAGAIAIYFMAAVTWASGLAQHKTVSGIDVFYGVVPAQVVQNHVQKHGEAPMHRKERFAKGLHHLVITLYDAKTSERITNAAVTATVTPLGLTPESRSLEIMKINDTVSYGNYFSMPPGDTSYRIVVSIRRPADHLPVTAEFDYRHATSR